MGWFDFFKKPDFNEGLEIYRNTKNAVLVDVRTPEEFSEGRVPGSRNIPLQDIGKIERLLKDKAIPVFVYCLSGARSSAAAAQLHQLGYAKVTNLGGISSYRGKVER